MFGKIKHSNKYYASETKSFIKKPSNAKQLNKVQNIWIIKLSLNW